jgi:hypothetical protein
MTVAEDVLVQSFREALPAVHNRDMWVNETYLEYRRLRILRAEGVTLIPDEESLLALLLQFEPEASEAAASPNGREAYQDRFGHAPTYCWTVPVADLCLRLASGSSAPGTAWMGKDA